MNRPIIAELQTRPRTTALLIAIVTAMVLAINGWYLMLGITTVLPHLFYIPIILTAYFFPRRGVLFAGIISLMYGAMACILTPEYVEVISAAGRIVIFVLIAAVVSFLTLRMQESERQFRGVTERSSDIILLTEAGGKALYVSPSVQKTLGYDPADISGHMPQEFIHPDDHRFLNEAIRHIVKGSPKEEIRLRMRKKDGDYAVIEFSGSPVIQQGKFTGMQVIGRDVTERRKSEEALRESEEKYRMLADYTYDWEYWINPDGTLRYTTPSCERITGYTPREFADNKELIRNIMHPDDIHAMDHHLSLEFSKQHPCAVDFRIIHRNGGTRWIGHVCQPIYNEQGEFIGRRASNRDITDRKQGESELRDTSRRLADIIDFLPDPTMVIDLEGKITAWNHAMEKLTGIHADVIIGQGNYAYAVWFYGRARPVLIDLVVRNDHEGIARMYPRYRRVGQTIFAEVETERPGGTRIQFWVTATPLVNQNGVITGAIESLRDVTHQKTIDRALRESKDYLDAIINTISDPVFVKDNSHKFVIVNDGFCRFSGYAREELLGKTDYDFFPGDEADIYRRKDEEVFATRQGNENEEILTDAAGNRHTIVTKKSLYANSEGEQFIVGIIRDISERKHMETALRQVNKKLNLLSSITRHDINNQIFAIKAFLELSKESLNDPGVIAEFILKAESAAGAIERQIAFTKQYQDLGVKEPVWQNAGVCVTKAVTSLPVRDIRVADETGSIEIYADPLFEKVFYNLIDNALRYGGSKMTMIRFSVQQSGQDMIIAIDDDGAGITAEDKKRLFERGFGKHTGLGLFLSREILSITGITITETGTPGNGARFEITVPDGAWRRTGSS